MKWLHREIANSRTYQLSWKPNETNQQDRRNFSHALPRRLPAEVIVRRGPTGDGCRASRSPSCTAAWRVERVATPGTGQREGTRRGQPLCADRLRPFDSREQLRLRSVLPSPVCCRRSICRTISDMHAALTRRDGWITELARQFGQGEPAQSQAAAPAGLPEAGRPLSGPASVACARPARRPRRTSCRNSSTQLREAVWAARPRRAGIGPPIVAAHQPAGQRAGGGCLSAHVEPLPERTTSCVPPSSTCSRPRISDRDPRRAVGLVNTKEFIVNH